MWARMTVPTQKGTHMVVDKQLREVKEQLLNPGAVWLGQYISPMTMTVAGGMVGILAGMATLHAAYGVGLVLWLVNRVMDGLDGTIARKTNQQSDFGGYVDILIDHMVYAAIPIFMAISVGQTAVYIALALMLMSFYMNTASWAVLSSILEKRNLGAAANRQPTTISMPTGIIEGTETIIGYVLFFLFPGYLAWLFGGMALLVGLTILQRLLWARKHL